MDTRKPSENPLTRSALAEATFTLDQLRVFLAITELGSFSAAAKALHRAQSAVSHAIAGLESQLGLPLFVRGRRRPVLTDAASALLPRARELLSAARGIATTANQWAGGLEPQISIAVDMMFPTAPLLAALAGFQSRFPAVKLVLRTEGLGAVHQLVMDRTCQLGIGLALPMHRTESLSRRALCKVRLIQVAAAKHPLSSVSRCTDAVLRQYTQLVITDRSELTAGTDFGVMGGPTWRFADLNAKHACLLAGLGWGSMPEHVVADDLKRGRLVKLRMRENVVAVTMAAFFVPGWSPGPAASWLLGQLGSEKEPTDS